MRKAFRRMAGALLLSVAARTMAVPVAGAAPPTPEDDPFYDYAGSTPLAQIAPGTVLKSRTLNYHVADSAGCRVPILLRFAEPDRRALLRDLRRTHPGRRDPPGRVGADRSRAPRRQDRGRRRHRGRERRLRRRARVRAEHPRQPPGRARRACHRPRRNEEDRTTPLFIGQGALGELEGTPGNKPGIGEGDGVMIAGDVRTLARQYCERGDKVLYDEYPLGHITAAVPWVTTAVPWLEARFAGTSAPSSCGSIAPATQSPRSPNRHDVDGPKTCLYV